MEDLTEKEQLEALRTWWAENGNYVVGGIIVGVIIIFGWNRWQTGVAETEIAASSLYEDVMEAAGRGNLDNAATAAASLFRDYAKTPYAAQARLAMARMYMDSGRDQDAVDVLQPLVDADAKNELAQVARLRLAKILLYQDRAQEVVDLLKGMPESAFSSRFNEVLGDAYVALGSFTEAEAAYVAALNDNPLARTVDGSLIQLKINDLPIVDELAAAEPEVSDVEDAGDETPPAEGSDTETPDNDAGEDAEPGDE